MSDVRRALTPTTPAAAMPAAQAANDTHAGVSAQALRIVEAVLFASGATMTAQQLRDHIGAEADIARVLAALQRAYAGRGVELVETGGGWRFQTAKDLASLFHATREKPKKPPRAMMETLAIIAYHQPVTRAEIEEVRGVSLSKGVLDALLDLGWVRPRGRRRTPGRPLTFGTTETFLSHFGLVGLDALPGKEDLTAAGYIDARLAQRLDVPRPGEGADENEDPLDDHAAAHGVEAADFFTDHLSEDGD